MRLAVLMSCLKVLSLGRFLENRRPQQDVWSTGLVRGQVLNHEEKNHKLLRRYRYTRSHYTCTADLDCWKLAPISQIKAGQARLYLKL